MIVGGPDIGIEYPLLFEHKALRSSSWQDLVTRGVKASKPIYWAQVQVYMAYLAVERTLFVALDKDTQALRFELVVLDPSAAQALSDKAVAVIRAVEAHDPLPRISDPPDFYICTFCPYRIRCHALAPGGNA